LYYILQYFKVYFNKLDRIPKLNQGGGSAEKVEAQERNEYQPLNIVGSEPELYPNKLLGANGHFFITFSN
jgi:hypothetical protein